MNCWSRRCAFGMERLPCHRDRVLGSNSIRQRSNASGCRKTCLFPTAIIPIWFLDATILRPPGPMMCRKCASYHNPPPIPGWLLRRTPTHPEMAHITYSEAIRQTLRTLMQNDERVVLLGEDIGRYEGVFKCTRGLLSEFG